MWSPRTQEEIDIAEEKAMNDEGEDVKHLGRFDLLGEHEDLFVGLLGDVRLCGRNAEILIDDEDSPYDAERIKLLARSAFKARREFDSLGKRGQIGPGAGEDWFPPFVEDMLSFREKLDKLKYSFELYFKEVGGKWK